MSDIDPSAQPAPRGNLDQGRSSASAPPSGASPDPAPTPASSSFDFNHPTIVSLLYLSSMVLGVTAIVGVVLAYVWKGEAHADWEASHYQYLIRTFWIGLIGSLVSVLFMILLIGFVMLLAVAVLVLVRCVLSLVNAQKQMPMPNPESLFI